MSCAGNLLQLQVLSKLIYRASPRISLARHSHLHIAIDRRLEKLLSLRAAFIDVKSCPGLIFFALHSVSQVRLAERRANGSCLTSRRRAPSLNGKQIIKTKQKRFPLMSTSIESEYVGCSFLFASSTAKPKPKPSLFFLRSSFAIVFFGEIHIRESRIHKHGLRAAIETWAATCNRTRKSR